MSKWRVDPEAPPVRDGLALLVGEHGTAQNVVDAANVAFAFGLQPLEHIEIETYSCLPLDRPEELVLARGVRPLLRRNRARVGILVEFAIAPVAVELRELSA